VRVSVAEHTIELAGTPVFYRQAEGSHPATLYLHSAPTSSDDWVGSLERTGGVAVDLPGFGRSGKSGHLSYSLQEYATVISQLLGALQIETVTLVGHGWGGASALVFAQLHPERVEKLVLVNAVPLLEGYSMPPLIRRLRRAGLGELVMGSVNRWMLARTLRGASVRPRAWSSERLDQVWQQFDEGTLRAVLRLLRSIDSQELAAAGLDLERIQASTLVVWGERDPWIPADFAHRYAERLPTAQLLLVPEAGHWPWLDDPSLVERIADFVTDDG
jgi:pimeloyl-ACP methyl ester carboxylesterase